MTLTKLKTVPNLWLVIRVGWSCLVLGTIIFLCGLMFPHYYIYILGYLYVIFSVIISLIALLIAVITIMINKRNCQLGIIAIYCLLINIPIAYWYAQIIISYA